MVVRVLSADSGDDVEAYRTIRLEALLADPGAFGSTYEREVAFDDRTWRRRVSGFDGRPGITLVDEIDGAVVGTAGIGYTEHNEQPMLVGMWVRPEARGQGVGKRLIDAAVDWAVSRQAKDIILWVVTENLSAISLYERCGFVVSGKVETLPANPCSNELEMRRTLGANAHDEQ